MKTIKKLLSLLIIIVLLSSCTASKKEKDNRDLFADMIVLYANHVNKIIDKKILLLQRKLALNLTQTEMLFILKGELISIIPEIRHMIFSSQIIAIELLEHDDPQIADVNKFYEKMDIYNQIMRDTIVARMIEFHSTLNHKQKEKIVKMLDHGQLFSFPLKYYGFRKIFKSFHELYRHLNFTKKQRKELSTLFDTQTKKTRENNKTLIHELEAQKKNLKKMILAESITITEIDTMADDIQHALENHKQQTAQAVLDFCNILDAEQKTMLIEFISGFDRY